jgi:hypothetical protein
MQPDFVELALPSAADARRYAGELKPGDQYFSMGFLWIKIS